MNMLYDFYSSELQPVLIEQERSRKRIFSSIRFNLMFVLVVGTVSIPFVAPNVALWFGIGFINAAILMSILCFIYMGLTCRAIIKNHKVEVKQHTISKVIQFIDPSLRYRAEASISGLELVASGFFEPSTTVDVVGEDLIEGNAFGTKFQCAEIHLPRMSSEFNDGELQRLSVRAQGFKGLFAVIDLPKRLDSVVYIFPNNAVGRVNRLGVGRGGLERIKLEDPMFEKYFNAYGTDQLQSRMILTTKLIDDIAMLRERMGSSIMLSIKHNKLYIAVSSSKDLFEPNIHKSYLNPEHVRNYLKELNIVVQLVKDVQEIFAATP